MEYFRSLRLVPVLLLGLAGLGILFSVDVASGQGRATTTIVRDTFDHTAFDRLLTQFVDGKDGWPTTP